MITIYGKDSCTFCDQAVQLCKQKGVDYEYKKLGVDFDKEWIVCHIGSYGVIPRTMPQVVDENGYVGGFAELKTKLM